MTDGNGISNKTIVFYRQLFRSYNIFSCFTVSFIEVLFFGKLPRYGDVVMMNFLNCQNIVINVALGISLEAIC